MKTFNSGFFFVAEGHGAFDTRAIGDREIIAKPVTVGGPAVGGGLLLREQGAGAFRWLAPDAEHAYLADPAYWDRR